MRRLLVSLSVFFGLLTPIALALPVSAQGPLDQVCQNSGASSAVCGGRTNNNQVAYTIIRAAQIILLITGIAAVITIIISGFRYVISSGDPSSVNNAKNAIIYAVIGLAISALAQFIIIFVLNRIS